MRAITLPSRAPRETFDFAGGTGTTATPWGHERLAGEAGWVLDAAMRETGDGTSAAYLDNADAHEIADLRLGTRTEQLYAEGEFQAAPTASRASAAADAAGAKRTPWRPAVTRRAEPPPG